MKHNYCLEIKSFLLLMVRPTSKRMGKFTVQSNHTVEAPLVNFGIQNDAKIDNIVVTNKIKLPVQRGLSNVTSAGQIVLNSQDGGFYGSTGSNWIPITNKPELERINVQKGQNPNPNVKTTLIDGLNAEIQWGTRAGGDNNEMSISNKYVALNNADVAFLGIEYESNPLKVYNTVGQLAFTVPYVGPFENAALVKYSPIGEPVLNGYVNGNIQSFSVIDLNDTNEAVASGYYQSGMLSVYNSSFTLVTTLELVGLRDIYLLKYSADNSLDWATRLSSPGNDFAYGCAISNLGNVVISGEFNGFTLKFYNAGSNSFTTVYNTGSAVFLGKYTSTGVVDWVTKIATGSIRAGGLNSINRTTERIVVGVSSGSDVTPFNANGTPGTTILRNGFNAIDSIISYSPTGSFQWGAGMCYNKSPGVIEYMSNINVNTSGDIVAVGYYSGSTLNVYDSTNTLAFQLKKPAVAFETDAFVVKYNSSGFPEWGAKITGNSDEYDISASINDLGNIMVSGSFYSDVLSIYDAAGNVAVTFGGSVSAGEYYLVNYSSSGQVMWATKINSQNTDSVYYTAVSINNLNNLLVTGNYLSSPLNAFNTDGSCGLTLPNDSSANDMFIIKYKSATNVSLNNPLLDGETKVIQSIGPTVIIDTQGTIQGYSNQILLKNGQLVNMIWDALSNNWVTSINGGTIL